MKKCEQCGYENNDDSKFCTGCGQALNSNNSTNDATSKTTNNTNNQSSSEATNNVNNQTSNNATNNANNNTNYDDANNFNQQNMVNNNQFVRDPGVPKDMSEVLIDPNEKVITTFGNSYLQSIFLSKNAEKFAYVLTDKRLYFKGTGYYYKNKVGVRCVVEQVIDLEDITGTGFKTAGNLKLILIILGIPLIIVFCIGLILITIAIVLYIVQKDTYFVVEYAGGKIDSNIKLYGQGPAQDFLKQIRRAKDKMVGR